MVQEIVCLGFERVGSDNHNGVGEFRILVAVVQFTHSHITSGMDLGVISRTVMYSDVLDLHRPEIELAGAPCILVAAARSTMIKGRHEHPILAHIVDDRDGDARNEVAALFSARWFYSHRPSRLF